MNTIEVAEVLPYYVVTPSANDRYLEILPHDDAPIKPGTVATFRGPIAFGPHKGKIASVTGKVCDWRMQGPIATWDDPGSIVVDTKAE